MEYSKEVVELAESFALDVELQDGEFDFIILNSKHLSDLEFCMDNFVKLDAIKAYYGYFNTINDFEENYLGDFSNDEEFMENFDYFGFLDNVCNNVVNYIDYEKLTRDLMMDFVEIDGYYFYNN